MTYLLLTILFTLLITVGTWFSSELVERLAFSPYAITKYKQFDRFITHGFLHTDPLHLLLNMVVLYFFGQILETLYNAKFGESGFLSFYIVAIIISSLPDFIRHRTDKSFLSVGASGAVSAVIFAVIVIIPWYPLYFLGFIPIPAISCGALFIAYSIYVHQRGKTGINHLAHFTGAMFGVIISIIAEPSVIISFYHAFTEHILSF